MNKVNTLKKQTCPTAAEVDHSRLLGKLQGIARHWLRPFIGKLQGDLLTCPFPFDGYYNGKCWRFTPLVRFPFVGIFVGMSQNVTV